MQSWRNQPEPKLARLQEQLDDGMVRCHLSPRNCRIRPGQHGFCMVRANRDGRLVSLNYGRSVHATEETIETEAVFHYAPGARILSMGNIGCMLNCDYCHNWKTSQARFVDDRDVYHYTPEEVVDIALRHGIRVISWTYNDPVVWHEFVVETAGLARQAGIANLYKSAFFITEEAVEELLPVIDIFSISIKSMDPVYYRRLTKGWIEPVLAATEQVFPAGKHVEVSTLMVTGLSDDDHTAAKIAEFVGERLSPEVPTHFVRFHPDYKMTDTVRTPVERLERARRVALDMGLHHVYLGNVYRSDVSETRCRKCDTLQVSRFGLHAELVGVTNENLCTGCGTPTAFTMLPDPDLGREQIDALPTGPEGLADRSFEVARYGWHGDICSVHIQVMNTTGTVQCLYQRRYGDGFSSGWSVLRLAPGERYRMIAAKSDLREAGVEVAVPTGCTSSLHEVFDRAHFPVGDVSGRAVPIGDVTPFPRYEPLTRS